MKKHIKAAGEMAEGDQFPSELRYDAVSKNWVVVASRRGKRPNIFKKKEEKEEDAFDCPFCKKENLVDAVEVFNKGKKVSFDGDFYSDDWTVLSIPNKFPAFLPSDKLNRSDESDLYKKIDAVGYHEVIITKDHQKSLGQMKKDEVAEVLNIYQKRFLKLRNKPYVNYVLIFHNHKKEAGASVSHPHSQLITTPIFGIDLEAAFRNSQKYMKKNGRCIFCDMQKEEIKKDERIVYQNEEFLVLSPFAPNVAFQLVVTPKEHLSHFEDAKKKTMEYLTDAFSEAIRKIYYGLKNPPYNFYLHSAPCDGQNHNYYHWHFTILPKTATFAGFELGAGMEISTIKPEEATKHLKNI